MNQIRSAFIIFMLMMLPLPTISAPYFTVGVVPQYEISEIHKIWRPILDYLQQETGHLFEIRGSNSIEDFEKQFERGDFDFAYMNPYHLIVANQSAGYIPLVRDEKKSLHGILVVRKDSNIQSLLDLNKQKIAFPAPNALGASLMIRKELNNSGIEYSPLYVKSHDSVYLNVMLGITAAGGGVQKTLNKQDPAIRDNLRILHQTQQVVPHPFCALPKVPEQIRTQVTQALIDLGRTDKGQLMLARIPIRNVISTDIDDYRELQDLNLQSLYEN